MSRAWNNKDKMPKSGQFSKSSRLHRTMSQYEDVELAQSVGKVTGNLTPSSDPVRMLALQRGVGNRSIQRLLKKSTEKIQTRKPNDTNGTRQVLQRQEAEYGESFTVRYDVQIVPQTSDMSCWAASAAMLVSWRDNISINDEIIAKGANYWRTYFLTGLPPEDLHMFRQWGLIEEEPQSFTIQAYRNMLEAYGPLWVAADANSAPDKEAPHIRVITGMYGDGTPTGTFFAINDPAGGRAYVESVATFTGAQAELAESEATSFERPIYVAHL